MLKKTITLSILIICLLLVVWGCKEDGGVNEPINDQSTEEKIANNLVVLNGAGNVYADTLLATQDSISALNAMGQWIVSQENVKEAYYDGPSVVKIYFDNGLRSSILLIPTDENGRHLIRGGGEVNQLSKFDFNIQINSTKKIKNNKVLVLNPFSKEFEYGDYSRQLKLFEGGSEIFDVTVLSDSDVSFDAINSFGEYGFIILNTHGLKDGFFVNENYKFQAPGEGTESQTDMFLKAVKLTENLPLDKLENGELEFASLITTRGNNVSGDYYKVLVTDEYIRKSSIDLTDVVLFGNHCFSGHTADGPTTNNMAEAWRSKGLATYYGYSLNDGEGDIVKDYFCQAMEDSLIINLAQNTDSTGIAHLASNNSMQFYNNRVGYLNTKKIVKGEALIPPVFLNSRFWLYFNQYFDKNYKYGGCDSAYIAQKIFYLTANLGTFNYEALSINASGQDVSQESIYISNSLRIKTVSNAILPNVTGVTAVMEIVGKNVDYTSGKFAIGGPDSPYAARLTYQVAGGTIPYSSAYAEPNSGELVITNFCENYIEGTFHFQAKTSLPDSPILGVANGKFQIFLKL